ncbi:MAG: hypothetical protein WB723_06750 [Candidatus Acidiferrales bacterium]
MRTSAILQRVILVVIGAAALVYAGDYLWARHLMAGGSSAALGSVMVHHEWDIPRKDGRVEFDVDPAEAESCIHAMFPHFGYTPCWYAVRHTTVQN